MSTPDLNLLLTLDAVLSEGSVVRAAARLHLSPSAMSRALARLRETTGDPLLVRVGRGMAPTPRALALREQVAELVAQAKAALRPATPLAPAKLVRTFTLRTRDGFVENFGPALIARVGAEAPGVRLCFVQKPNRDASALRDGAADLETGIVDSATGPALCAAPLFTDRFIGVVRRAHPLARGKVSALRYAQGRHVGLAMGPQDHGAIDDALALRGLQRTVVTVVGGFSTALALARASDLIATVPEKHSGNLREGMHSFALPVPTAALNVSLLWHPRLDADQAHRWLRAIVLDTCAAA